MAYLALYRKFRPTGFDGLIGQEHIVRILQSQIKSGNIGHAYLFCGSRGTGKTSAAKIFARAVNCLSPQNGSPCGRCAVCHALSGSNNMDILEIDAASNNKVEEIRDLRENVQYPPVSGRYKVYIIDEVHMLTDSAFNALLKTLEEPPPHALFILATTEVHKLPATILSRCMRFDFRLVSVQNITALLESVFKDIGKDYEIAALREIARAAEGSVRDSLSIADMCVSITDGKLKHSEVLGVLSASDRGKIADIGDSILNGDTDAVLTKIDELCSGGKSVTVAGKDLITYFRDLLVIKNSKNPEEILPLTKEILEQYNKSAKKADYKKILSCIELFSELESVLRYSLHPRISFEAAALRAASPAQDYDNTDLLLKINDLTDKVALLTEKLRGFKAGTGESNTALPRENPETPAAPSKSREKSGYGDSLPKLPEFKEEPAVYNFAPLETDIPPFDADIPPFDTAGLMPPQEGSIDMAGGGFLAEERPRETAKPQIKADKRDKTTYDNAAQAENAAAAEYGNVGSINAQSAAEITGQEVSGKDITDAFKEKEQRAPQKTAGISAGAIWGSVIKSLRQSSSGMLYTLCSELTAEIEGSEFIIYTDSSMVADILNKPKNMDLLKGIINSDGEYNIRVENTSAKPVDKDLQAVKKLTGDKLIIK